MSMTDLIDIPRQYTAFAEWAACCIFILLLSDKIRGLKLYLYLTLGLAYFSLYHYVAGLLPVTLWIPGMLGAIGSMFLFIFLLTKIPWTDAAYCCIHAFIFAELLASLQWQVYAWWALWNNRTNQIVSIVLMVLIYLAAYWIYYRHVKKPVPNPEYSLNKRELGSAAIVGLCAFSISNLSFILPNTPLALSTSFFYIRTLVDFSGLVMLIVMYDSTEELHMRNENELMNVLLQRQYEQYRSSLDSVELLRREYHDLKHYMIAIRSAESSEQQEQYLYEMENAILTQEALTDTGNKVLDVLLTTKSSYCLKHNITFTCMVDGQQLDFIHVKDICSIFGNALDNAIECVCKINDFEKRIINLSVVKKNKFVIIKAENYSDSDLVLNAVNLPITTKEDARYHGYGLKSIQAAAHKYGGSMNTRLVNNWFTLQVLIPIG